MKFNYYKIINKTNGIKFISISEEEYYKNKPITLIKTVCNDYSLS